MTVATKLYGAVGSLALAATLVIGLGTWNLQTVCAELSTVADRTAVKIDLVNANRARVWEMVTTLYGMADSVNLNNPSEIDRRVRQWKFAWKRVTENSDVIRRLLVTESSREAMSRFESGSREFEKDSLEFMELCREHQADRLSEMKPRIEKFASLADDALGKLKDNQRRLLKDSQSRAADLRSTGMWVSISMSFVLVVIAFLAVSVVRGISRNLAIAVAEIAKGAEQVAAAANQVAASSESLAQGSSEQAASIEQTSASTEEINSMALRNTENCGAAASLVLESQRKFVETRGALEQTVAAIGDINAQSGRISKIIKTIDEIAFQTNILALNAAVEAARAGDAGMSFAVVADEVRNLAQRCAQAAKDTSELIEESIVKARDGKTKVDQVAVAIKTIAEDAAKVKVIVDEISQGSQQQTIGMAQIGKAIIQIEQVVQGTAATSEESAAAAEELSNQSKALNEVVQRLRAMMDESNTERRLHPAEARH